MVDKRLCCPELTVAQMVKQLSSAYTSLIKSEVPFKNFPSVMLWGPPGVGKSQGVREIAAEISEQTGKQVNITDVRLLLFNPVDLRGIPTANEDKTLAVWLRPKIFQMDESSDVINILFLDEISAAPQSVQAAAYQITLDRTVGEHRLPDNCIVLAAGNRVTDRSVAYTMPKALANRLCHLEIASDIKSWHVTTSSDCLDLFATIGALRSSDEQEILTRFMRAYSESPDLALKILFFARDVRGGLGERRVFRVCLKWLAKNAPSSAKKNLAHVAEYGRWDDLLSLIGTPCERDVLLLIKQQLEADLTALDNSGEVSLLAKWLPSVNASNAQTVALAKHISRSLGMADSAYRKTLVKLRERIRIIENNLREKDYTFDYSKQPSKAMFKYRKAFHRNDSERYSEFLRKVSRGEATLHTDTLMPYELVEPYLDWKAYTHTNRAFMRPIKDEERVSLNATWAAMPNFANDENALAVIDTSASMYNGGKPLPAAVALSLGLYFAEHNTGAFRNHFIEFSDHPQLIEIKGETFADRLRYVTSFNEIASTNLEAVFDLILSAAVRNGVPQEELPATLYIISDMEFNSCMTNASATNFENAKAKFEAHGYQLPRVVFWNVQSRNTQQPVTQNEQGVALVSGCTPRLFNMVSNGQMSPLGYMMEILGTERYAVIAA